MAEHPRQSPKRPQQHSPEPQQQPPDFWHFAAWMLLITLAVGYFLQPGDDQARVQLPWSEFKSHLKNGNVARVTLSGQEIRGELNQPVQAAQGRQSSRRFRTLRPPVEDPDLMRLLDERNVAVDVKSSDPPWLLQSLIHVLPWVLLIGLIFYSTRRMQQQMSGGDGVFGVGRSKARRFREGSTDVSFDDIAGLENAKSDLRDIINYLKDPERLQRLGAKPPHGILMMGRPGTGKTLLARAVAGEAGVPFYSISASEFIEMFVGVGASRVRDLFRQAKEEAPAIVFIDEIDAVGRTRGAGVGGGHDEREQTLNQILNEMDGFSGHEQVIVLAATNRPDVLDPALTRPGRFDRKVTLDLPHRQARRAILTVHTRKMPLADNVDLDNLAGRTVGFSGADLENLANEAALLAARENREEIDAALLDRARDKVLLGSERETLLTADEKERVACHESGHALLGCLLEHTDPVAKVSIVQRGQALGVTEQMPEEDRYNLRESYLRDRITVLFGGRVAERIIYGEVSSGAQDDLRQATQIARRMISQWGMNAELGPVGYQQGEEHVFLGREMAQQRDFSENTAERIDNEVRKLVRELEERAEQLLTDHRDKLESLARTLLEREVVDAAEIQRIVGKAGREKSSDDHHDGTDAARAAN
jgi:cell division protease FtsH